MRIYVYRRERTVRIEVSSRLLKSFIKKAKKKLQRFAESILASMGIACQLASMVGFVIVLLQTGVANVALVHQEELVVKGGDSSEK